jgi:excisionase family DNA binding protein
MIERLSGVVLDGDDLLFVARALDLLTKLMAEQRDPNGNPTPSTPTPRLESVASKLRRAVTNGSRTEANTSAGVTPVDGATHDSPREVTTDAAARILGCTPRNARDLAARKRLPARRSGGRWLLDATAVEALAARRNG